MDNFLISAENTIGIWGVIAGCVALAVYLEQKTKIGGKIGSVIFCLILGLICSNINLLPTASVAHDTIYSAIMPMALIMMMYQTDVRRILKNCGRQFILFHFSILGAILGIFILYSVYTVGFGLEEWRAFWPSATAGAIGGTINCVAMQSLFDVSPDLVSAEVLVGNFMMGAEIILVKVLNNTKFVRKNMKTPYIDEFESGLARLSNEEEEKNEAAMYWKAKDISMLDLALTLGVGLAILAASYAITGWSKTLGDNFFFQQILGSIYVVATVITTVLATVFPKFFGSLRAGDELGTIFLLTWFFAVGSDADLGKIITHAPLMLIETAVLFTAIAIITILAAKFITKSSWEEALTCTQASMGGPSTAVAQCIGFGWKKLIVPGIMLGLYGYVVGNICGIGVGYLINAPFK